MFVGTMFLQFSTGCLAAVKTRPGWPCHEESQPRAAVPHEDTAIMARMPMPQQSLHEGGSANGV